MRGFGNLSSLYIMSPSNYSPKKSGNPLEEEAERVEEADGMADTKKIRLSKSTGSAYV